MNNLVNSCIMLDDNNNRYSEFIKFSVVLFDAQNIPSTYLEYKEEHLQVYVQHLQVS